MDEEFEGLLAKSSRKALEHGWHSMVFNGFLRGW